MRFKLKQYNGLRLVLKVVSMFLVCPARVASESRFEAVGLFPDSRGIGEK